MIHFAGRKAVGESVDFPMLYYTHNVVGAVNLVEVMRKHNVKNVRPQAMKSSCPVGSSCPRHVVPNSTTRALPVQEVTPLVTLYRNSLSAHQAPHRGLQCLPRAQV